MSSNEHSEATAGTQECKAEPGRFRPVVDARRCEGKAECVTVCPYNVFEVGRISDDLFKAMPFPVRLKLRLHGRKTAYTPRADACQFCGLCVSACPNAQSGWSGSRLTDA